MLMKGKSASGKGLDDAGAEAIAIALLARVAGDPDRLERFLALSGLTPGTVRAASGEPGFLAAFLDHVAADDALLVAVAAEEGIAPEAVMAARARLSPEAPPDP